MTDETQGTELVPSQPGPAVNWDAATAEPDVYIAESRRLVETGQKRQAYQLEERRRTHREWQDTADDGPSPFLTDSGELDTAAVLATFDDVSPGDTQAVVDLGASDGRGVQGVIEDARDYIQAWAMHYPDTGPALLVFGVNNDLSKKFAAQHPRTVDAIGARDLEGLDPFTFEDHPGVIAKAAERWRALPEASGESLPTSSQTADEVPTDRASLERRHRQLSGEILRARDYNDRARMRELEAERAEINRQLGPTRPMVGRAGRRA